MAVRNAQNYGKKRILLAGSIVFLAVFLMRPGTAHGAISFTQSASGFSAAGTTSLTSTFATGTVAGDLVVVAVGWQSPDVTTPTSTVTDDKGNVYTAALGPMNAEGGYYIATYYAKNVVAGAKVITLGLGSSMTFVRMATHEYSGIDAVSPFDVAAANVGNASNPDSGLTATTTFADELLFGWCIDANGAVTAGAGYTQRVSVGAEITEDKIVAATGSYNATCGGDNSAWGIHLSAFKGSGAAAPATSTITFVQGASNFTNTSINATSSSVTLPAATTAGNLIVVAAGWSSAAITGAVTDDQGNTYVSAVLATSSAMAYSAQIFYAKNATGGVHTITLGVSAPAGFFRTLVHEYAGADTAAPLDGASGAIGSGALADSGSAATSAARDLLFGWCVNNSLAEAPGAGFSQRLVSGSELTEEAPGGAAGAQHATCQGANTSWMATFAAFKGTDTTPPTVGAFATTSVSQTSVTVSVSGASDSGSGLAAAPYLFQDLTTGGTSGSTSTASWTETGLTAGTAYTYRLTVSDAAGNAATTTLVVTTTAASGGGATPAPSPTPATQSVSAGGPIALPFAINDGAASTLDPHVTLVFHVSGAFPFAIARTPEALSSARVMAYVSTFPWTLCEPADCAPGVYPLYARFFEGGTTFFDASSSIRYVAGGAPKNGGSTNGAVAGVRECFAFELAPPERTLFFDLAPGVTSSYVRTLQRFLNVNGFAVAAQGAGSPGNETNYFGARTVKALAAFKGAYKARIGLSVITGGLDRKTREYMNALPPSFCGR